MDFSLVPSNKKMGTAVIRLCNQCSLLKNCVGINGAAGWSKRARIQNPGDYREQVVKGVLFARDACQQADPKRPRVVLLHTWITSIKQSRA